MMQIHFDDDPSNYNTTMASFCDLIYRIKSIGHIDVAKLGFCSWCLA